MRVSRVQGDLLDQRVDVIVNAWNRNFIPWWLLLPQGVSGAIKRRGGTEPFRELSRMGVLKTGQAVLTSAGRLSFRGIIHVAALEWYWRATTRAVIDSVKNALRLAEEHGFASIAFPALGAGTGGMEPERSITLIAETAASVPGTIDVAVVEFVPTASKKSNAHCLPL